MNLTLNSKILLLCSFTLVCELVFVGFLSRMLISSQGIIKEERRTREMIQRLQALSLVEQKMCMGMILEVDFRDKPGSPEFYDTYWQYYQKIPELINDLKQRVSGDKHELESVTALEDPTRAAQKLIEDCRHKIVDQNIDQLQVAPYKASLGQLLEEISMRTSEIEKDYKEKEDQIVKEQADWQRFIKQLLVGGVVFNILLAIGSAFMLTRAISKRLNALKENSNRLAVGLPLIPRQEGSDEIAVVDKAFHKMAGALAEAQARERAVIDNAVDLICSIDSTDRFTAVNQACREVLGYEPDDLIGRRFVDVVSDEDREKTRALFERAAGAGSAEKLENRLITKAGEIKHVLWSIQWSAERHSYFCVVHDITERHQIEQLKREFVAIVSHDLRTPLTSVQGTLDLLAEGIIDPAGDDARRKIANAANSTKRLIRLVNDLLDIEVMESGKLSLKLSEWKLSSLIEQAFESVRVFAEQQGVSLVAPKSDLTVCCDRERLIQVFVNLLSNAVKFSPRGKTVSVSYEQAQEQESVEIAIKDEGPGIPEDKLASIFERFKQLERADGRKRDGAGLGLTICKAIMEAHAGEIRVASKEGEGATFFVRVSTRGTSHSQLSR